MKLEVGKFYRSDDGRKMYVAALGRPHQTATVVGWDETALIYTWEKDGRHNYTGPGLVAEWTEPPPAELFVNIYEGEDTFVAYLTPKDAHNRNGRDALKIAVRYVPAKDRP